MAPKVLLIAGDASEDLEVYYPYQRLLEEGYEVDIAAPSVKTLQLVIHDFVSTFDTFTEKPGHTIKSTIALKDVKPEAYAALVVPGGRAPEYLRNDPSVPPIVQHFATADKPIAHVCHGGLILAAAGVIKGKKTAAYPALKPDITVAGGVWDEAVPVVDGKIVSAQAWPDHPAWFRAFLAILRKDAPVN